MDGCRCCRVVGQVNAHLEAAQVNGATYAVDWVDIADSNPSFPFTPGQPAPTTNNAALQHVGNQGHAQGAAHFSRLEGAVFTRHEIYFTSTQGGGPAETGPQLILGYGRGAGQVWSVQPAHAGADMSLPVARPRDARTARQHHRARMTAGPSSCAKTARPTTTFAASPGTPPNSTSR